MQISDLPGQRGPCLLAFPGAGGQHIQGTAGRGGRHDDCSAYIIKAPRTGEKSNGNQNNNANPR